MNWKTWLIDLGLASLAVMGVQLVALQNDAVDWETWAKGAGTALAACGIGPTVQFLATLRAKYAAAPVATPARTSGIQPPEAWPRE